MKKGIDWSWVGVSGLLVLAAFGGGTWAGAHHSSLTSLAWWQEWWTPGQIGARRALEPDWRPDLLLEELAKRVADVRGRLERSRREEREAWTAANLLRQQGQGRSLAWREQEALRRHWASQRHLLQAALDEALRLEGELRQAVQADAAGEAWEIDPDLHRRASIYLIRRDLLRDVPAP